MDFIIVLFRDWISGFWYFIYILVCIFFMFVLLGIVGDRKRYVINERLKEKKKRDIESGREAQIAAMASKQILDVMKDPEVEQPNMEPSNDSEDLTKKEEAPSVLVIGADGSSNSQSTPSPAVGQNNVTTIFPSQTLQQGSSTSSAVTGNPPVQG